MKTTCETGLIVPAYAKINLSLDVLRKRSDGYHDLHMVMQQISLCDHVHLQLTQTPGITLTTNAPYLPTGPGNIAWKAAESLGTLAGMNLSETGLKISITKQIPVAAGLAGGSADAAAVLKGLNQLWRLNLSLVELQRIGLQLGADVPYCLMGGSALAEGIGDKLTPLKLDKPLWVVLVKPGQSVSTRDVYQGLRLDLVAKRPDNMGLISAMAQGDLKKMSLAMDNVLENVTIAMVPEIKEIKKKLIEYNAAVSLMSGSGPTVFGLFKDQAKAQGAGSKLGRLYRDVHVAHTIST